MDVQIYPRQDLEVYGYIPRNVTMGQMVLLFLIVFE